LNSTIFPTSDELYAKFCKKHGLIPKTETLEDGTTAHWIGSSSAEKVLAYFHGMFRRKFFGLKEDQQKYRWRVYVSISKYAQWSPLALPPVPSRSQERNRDPHSRLRYIFQAVCLSSSLFVLLTPIDLIPTTQYPRQLQQVISILNHLIRNLHKSPSNIIHYGDTGGGNLTTAVLLYLSHPHPSTSTPITPLKLRGIILSPSGFPSPVPPHPSPPTQSRSLVSTHLLKMVCCNHRHL
jgi:acetyl esterase/lipase